MELGIIVTVIISNPHVYAFLLYHYALLFRKASQKNLIIKYKEKPNVCSKHIWK